MGEVRNRAKVWPATLPAARVSQEIKDAIAAEMQRTGASESDVIREWLELGRQAAARRIKRDGSAPMAPVDPN